MTAITHTYPRDTQSAFERLLDIEIVRILLAGMYALLGLHLTPREKAQQRERAIRLRKVQYEVDLSEALIA